MADLLSLALEAHGGLDRWRELETLDARLSVSGGLWRLKGHPEGLPNVSLRVAARHQAVRIAPFHGEEHAGYFQPDRVWIEDEAGVVVQHRANPRASFAGHVRTTPWDDLHELYFIGYAMWNYFTIPFLFAQPGFEVREVDSHCENGDKWRSLQVTFPAHIHTHNGFQPGGEQTFYFNENGLLQRLDYLAVGPAAHYCFDHTTFSGLVFPTLRRVVPRAPAGPLVNGPTSVLLQISDVTAA
jgi:hypothetical protein